MRKFILLIYFIFVSWPIFAQVDVQETNLFDNLEDSDRVFSLDYYTGKNAVRSGDEFYLVDIYTGYRPIIFIQNVKNIISIKNIAAFDRKTGQQLPEDDLLLLKIDMENMTSIMQEVFPNSTFGGKSRTGIRFKMIIDPDTFKVKEVRFSLHFTENDFSIFAVPPCKIRQLESLIKERIVATFPCTDEMLCEGRRDMSYHIAYCYIPFSEFRL